MSEPYRYMWREDREYLAGGCWSVIEDETGENMGNFVSESDAEDMCWDLNQAAGARNEVK